MKMLNEMEQDELLIVPTSEIVFGIKTDGTFINNIFKKDDPNVKYFFQGTLAFMDSLDPSNVIHRAFMATYVMMSAALCDSILARMNDADKRAEDNQL